jgi:tetratricopeptide (TPR) repeat protein
MLHALLLAGALLCVPASNAQDFAGLTREDILAMLQQGDYDGLDLRLNALQKRFEEDAGAEDALLGGFRVFGAVHSDTDAVEQALTGWVERYPQSYAARLARGIFYIDRGLDARGTQYASKTSARQFEQMEHWFERGREDLNASLELSSKPLLTHMWLITQAMRSRADHGEERYYRTALAYAPRSIELRVLYMTQLEPRWGGSYEEMEAHAKDSEAALGPGEQINRLYRMIAEDRGHVLMDQEKYAAAHAVYTEAIERHGGRGLRCGRARARAMLDRWPEAVQDVTEAMQEPKPHGFCADTAAWMAGRQSDYPGMFELMDGYLQHNPRHAELLTRRGWALQQRGELAAAYEDYALAAEDGNVWAQTMTGRYVFNGWGGVPVDHEKGLALFRAAAETGDANAQLCLVEALQYLGRKEEAGRVNQRFAVQKRSRAHTSAATAKEAPVHFEGWLAYTQDRRLQAVGLGLLLVLLVVARAPRSKK